ncbi:MAG: NADH-quinone oxidoreductase subunit L [Candidatus Micrarchaeota archaeon]|nr:NADH-quinone oxidoreductase subunit L [Candidatus Micrarchaeota archaeon]
MIPILLSLAPLLVAILIIGLLRKETKAIKYIALLGSLLPLAFVPLFAGQIGSTEAMNWFSVGNAQFNVVASMLPINFLLFALVSIIGPLVVLYSLGFMNVLSENRRFYIEILAFQAAMLAFSVSGSFLLVFIAWEFLSVTSYLLIGFWNYKDAANHAARKTITIILIGDIAMLAAMAILFATYGTLDFSGIISSTVQASTAALVLILIAVMTKSAQFPFQEWLAAAMEGPTPVSAFLHSSTMVKAGVFLIMLLFPLFIGSKSLLMAIAVIGAITALVGISNALVSRHVKRVLAYSTVEELGLMMFALGIGAYAAAVYFFFAQTFYKALLFFYSGTLMKVNNTDDITEMRNATRNKPLLISALFGVLALAGFIPFNGFFSNIALESAQSNMYAYAFMLLVDILVALFIFRWFFLPTKRITNRGIGAKLDLGYDTIPMSMKIPVFLLAALCLATSYLVNYVGDVAASMKSYGYAIASASAAGLADIGIETLLVAIALVAAYALYYRGKYAESKNRALLLAKSILGNRNLFNGLYYYIGMFGYYIAGAFEYADSELNAAFDGIGHLASAFGGAVRHIETGSVNLYAAATLAGLTIIMIAVILSLH